MKILLVLVSAILAGALAGWVSGSMRNAAAGEPARSAPAALEPAGNDQLAALEVELERQARELENLRMQLASSSAARTSAAQPAASAAPQVESASKTDGPPQEAGSAAAKTPDFDLGDALLRLAAKGMSWEEREALFERARKAGRLDELIGDLEAWAAERPEDPDAQVMLASAYVSKIQEVGAGPEAGRLAMKADGAYDLALQVDERHWEARFAKAMSLSFWPPVFGKQTEAIKHFEILAQQQEGQPAKQHFTQTYLMLGNAYQQVGQLDKALAAWQKGLAIFPTDASLAKQIANAKQAQGGH